MLAITFHLFLKVRGEKKDEQCENKNMGSVIPSRLNKVEIIVSIVSYKKGADSIVIYIISFITLYTSILPFLNFVYHWAFFFKSKKLQYLIIHFMIYSIA